MNSQDRRIGMSLLSVMKREDAPAMWKGIAESMDAATVGTFLDNLMNISIIVEHVFRTNYPDEHKAWCKRNDYEDIEDSSGIPPDKDEAL